MTKTTKVVKSEEEKSMRGTVSLFKNTTTGMLVYLRGKKIFLKTNGEVTAKPVDTITAGYLIRREHAAAVQAGKAKFVSIHAKLAKCKWGAEASLKLDKMVK